MVKANGELVVALMARNFTAADAADADAADADAADGRGRSLMAASSESPPPS